MSLYLWKLSLAKVANNVHSMVLLDFITSTARDNGCVDLGLQTALKNMLDSPFHVGNQIWLTKHLHLTGYDWIHELDLRLLTYAFRVDHK